jgi:GDP-D-mannose 3',5'-epimerase
MRLPGVSAEQSRRNSIKGRGRLPGCAEDGYGWEKLYTERLCRHYREDFGLDTRIVRFHNIYGPLGTYDGGREKSPAAICRKVALARNSDEIEVWGDGQQTRSYCYISDCIEGLHRLMRSEYPHPLNLGQDCMITINELVDIVAGIAGKKIKKKHDLTKPQGVRGRNSDNTRLREVLQWQPSVSLKEGLKETYSWITNQLIKSGRLPFSDTLAAGAAVGPL